MVCTGGQDAAQGASLQVELVEVRGVVDLQGVVVVGGSGPPELQSTSFCFCVGDGFERSKRAGGVGG